MQSPSRRDVLRLAGLAVPAGLALGAGGVAARRDDRRADRLRVAVVGAGQHGTKLTRALTRRVDCEVAFVCDPDDVRARQLAARVEAVQRRRPRVAADLRRALESDSVDAVVIATPHHWHALAAVWALQAGKHVYVEKPLTHSLPEGASILAAARKYGGVLEVGTQRRSQPSLRAAVAFMRAGGIGEVRAARCFSWMRREPINAPGAFPPPSSVDTGLWFGPRQVTTPTRSRFHYDWHWFWDFGNGGLGNNGVHRLDIARFGLGLSDHPNPLGDWVVSYGGRFGPPDAGETPNTQVSAHGFGAVTLTHELRGLPTGQPDGLPEGTEVVWVGTRGSVAYGKHQAVLLDDRGARVRAFGRASDPFARHVGHWVECARQGTRSAVRVGPREGHLSAGLVHVAAQAHRVGTEAGEAEVRAALEGLPSAVDLVGELERTSRHLRDNGVALRWALSPTLELAGESLLPGTPATLSPDRYRSGYRLPPPGDV